MSLFSYTYKQESFLATITTFCNFLMFNNTKHFYLTGFQHYQMVSLVLIFYVLMLFSAINTNSLFCNIISYIRNYKSKY